MVSSRKTKVTVGEMSIKLEDLPRNASIHAAGTLVSPIELMDYIPLLKPNTDGINATALNLSDAEKAGLTSYRPRVKCVNCGDEQMVA